MNRARRLFFLLSTDYCLLSTSFSRRVDVERVAEPLVVAGDVVLELADDLDGGVGRAEAGAGEGVALDAAVAHVAHVEAGDASAADVRKLVADDGEARALDAQAGLPHADDLVVADGHVAHRVAEGVDAVAQH